MASDADYHFRREAEELRRAWQARSERARRIHIELANQHRMRGLNHLLAFDEPRSDPLPAYEPAIAANSVRAAIRST